MDTPISWFGSIGLLEGTLSNQLGSVEEEACDALIAEVKERIHEPPTEGPFARRIPIRMVLASRDGVVDDEDRDIVRAIICAPISCSRR